LVPYSAMTASQVRGLEVLAIPRKGIASHVTPSERSFVHGQQVPQHWGGIRERRNNRQGRSLVTKSVQDNGAFRTPTLRNVELTAPYMHDGSLKDMKQVMDFYIGAGNSNPYLDKEIHSLDFLSRQERDDLLEFMRALNGTLPPNTGPPQVLAAQAAQ